MNQQLLDELMAMAKRDSETRARLLAAGKLYGDYAEEMQRVHKENAKRLDEIVDTYSWPGLALVGLEGCRAAWLVAQHAICTPALQRKFHAVMEQAVESGDVPKRLLACLTDRIRSTRTGHNSTARFWPGTRWANSRANSKIRRTSTREERRSVCRRSKKIWRSTAKRSNARAEKHQRITPTTGAKGANGRGASGGSD